MNNDKTCARCRASFSRYDTCDACNGTLCGLCCIPAQLVTIRDRLNLLSEERSALESQAERWLQDIAANASRA